jgi:ribosomal protein L37AE/L43A
LNINTGNFNSDNHHHPLTQTKRNAWNCNTCGNSFVQRYSWFCDRCDFDCCVNCMFVGGSTKMIQNSYEPFSNY